MTDFDDDFTVPITAWVAEEQKERQKTEEEQLHAAQREAQKSRHAIRAARARRRIEGERTRLAVRREELREQAESTRPHYIDALSDNIVELKNNRPTLRRSSWEHKVAQQEKILAALTKIQPFVARPLHSPTIVTIATAGTCDVTGIVSLLAKNRPLDTVTVVSLSQRKIFDGTWWVNSHDWLTHLDYMGRGGDISHDGFFPRISGNMYGCNGGVEIEPDLVDNLFAHARTGTLGTTIIIHVGLDEQPKILEKAVNYCDGLLVACDSAPQNLARTVATLQALEKRYQLVSDNAPIIIDGGTSQHKNSMSRLRPTMGSYVFSSDDPYNVDAMVGWSKLMTAVASRQKQAPPITPAFTSLHQDEGVDADLEARYQQQLMIRGGRVSLPTGVASILGGDIPVVEPVFDDDKIAHDISVRTGKRKRRATREAIITSTLIVVVGILIAIAAVVGSYVTSTIDPDAPHGHKDVSSLSDDIINTSVIPTPSDMANNGPSGVNDESDDVAIPRDGYKITYRVKTEGNISAASVTFLDEHNRPRSIAGISTPWEKTLGFSRESTPAVSIATTGEGTVTCSLVKNGKMMEQKSESGSNPQVQCGG